MLLTYNARRGRRLGQDTTQASNEIIEVPCPPRHSPPRLFPIPRLLHWFVSIGPAESNIGPLPRQSQSR